MKPRLETNTVRMNVTVRTDIKDALESLRDQWHMAEGGYVSMGRIFNEAALMLLEREMVPVTGQPRRTNAQKAPARRKRLEAAGV